MFFVFFICLLFITHMTHIPPQLVVTVTDSITHMTHIPPQLLVTVSHTDTSVTLLHQC